ncbi:YbbR-like domain-containing protein [Bacillus timonensis]|nr:YbbR-like domain-containing protein [Bacillus timonensis]
MDKLMYNHWFMKIIALLLSLLLYMSVSFETQPKSTNSSGLPLVSNDQETLIDVPVKSYFDEENLVVSGIPQYVNVSLDGPVSITKTIGLQKDFEVFVDLTDLSIGSHKVPLQYKNISDKVKVAIEPSEITVVIQEKVTKEFIVEVDFMNKALIKDGYIPEQPIIKPNVVKITGAKEDVERIALVKALVDLKDVSETIETESRVAVYDRNQNVLSVEVEPSIVGITVPISSPSKKVPFKINRQGSLKEGLSIVSLEALPKEVTIYGEKEVIEKIDFIDGINVDLNDISEDQTIEVKVPVPNGIKKVSPETIQIKIDVENEVKRTLSNLPIQSLGLADKFNLSYLDPESGRIDLDIFGALSVVNNISPTDMNVYINVTDLSQGEHTLKVEVNGPQNITWVLRQKNVSVSITENN